MSPDPEAALALLNLREDWFIELIATALQKHASASFLLERKNPY